MPFDELEPRLRLIGSVLLCAALSACSSKPDPATAQKAKDACVQACQARLQQKEDLSKGPCLSDGMSGGLVAPGFVCDVAHSPRQPVDDERTNQCNAFHDGRADHFVEVDPSCTFIKSE